MRLCVPSLTAIVLALFVPFTVAIASPCDRPAPAARIRADMQIPGAIADRGAPGAVIFVHGLAGDARSTWTNSNGTYWPALLATDPEFRSFDIYVFEYDTSFWAPCQSVPDVADALRRFTEDKRIFSRYDRVVFVAHSLGGVIVREFLIRFQSAIASKVPFVFYFGTPAGGSPLANALSRFTFCRQVDDLRSVDVNSLLQSQLAIWRNSPELQKIKVQCGVETRTTFGLAVAPRASSELGCTDSEALPYPHVELVKPACAADDRHIALRNAFRRFVHDEGEPMRNPIRLPEPVTSGSLGPAPRRTIDYDAIWRIVNDMSVEELVGQVLMVGTYAHDVSAANAALVDLVRRRHLGNVILFDQNFPEPKLQTELDVPRFVSQLTSELQAAAAASLPAERRIPLVIAADQEGGFIVRVKAGVTRIPEAMFLGATRDADAVRQAGRIVGSEMSAIGINTVLAPVADVNNSEKSDVIGKRAFGANKDIVVPLSYAFMRGLHDGGVLSIAKHYPGHGSSEENPEYVIAHTSYADLSEFEDNDLVPFWALAGEGVDGLLTSHIVVDQVDPLPATLSHKLVDEAIRGSMGFQGVIMSDDVTWMAGILHDEQGQTVRSRFDVTTGAFEAGHDIVLFARVSADGLPLPGRSVRVPHEGNWKESRLVTVPELEKTIDQLIGWFSAAPERMQLLRERVAVVLAMKGRLVPVDHFKDTSAWHRDFDEKAYEKMFEKHRVVAEQITQASVVLISEDGAVVNDIRSSRYFSPGRGPLSRGGLLREKDRVILADPTKWPNSPLLKELQERTKVPITSIPLIYGWGEDQRDEARQIWRRTVPIYSRIDPLGNFKPELPEIDRRVEEIVSKSRGARILLFGVITYDQAEMLARVCERLRNNSSIEIIVLLYREPYLIPNSVYRQRNVTVISLSLFPSFTRTVNLLTGRFLPKPVSYLSLSVPSIIRRNNNAGAPVVNLESLREPAIP